MASERTGTARVSMLTLSTFVVGSMVGAGVFSLPGEFAKSTGVAGTLIAWAIAGSGMLCLALVFRNLASRKPALDAGVYSYAKAGFGNYAGFFAAFGYWASACAGNVFYWVFITSTLSTVFPAFGEGNTIAAVAASSCGLWLFALLIRRGVRQAAALNRIVSIAKIVPIVAFVVLCLTVFDPAVFAANWDGGIDSGSLFDQVRATLLVTVFVFIGVEGASVNSRHARNRKDVGRATLLGFLSVLAVFASVTLVSYGILPREQIADLPAPAMGGVLASAIGPWGSVLVAVGLIVAVLGAYLSWTLMAAEVLLAAASDGALPKFLTKTNATDTPVSAVLMSTVLVQAMLVLVLFSKDAFSVALDLTSSLILIPFFLCALYGFGLALRKDADAPVRDSIVAGLATVYTVFLLIAGGLDYLLLSFLVIVPGTVLFIRARKQQGARVFSRREVIGVILVSLAALTALVLLFQGVIAL